MQPATAAALCPRKTRDGPRRRCRINLRGESGLRLFGTPHEMDVVSNPPLVDVRGVGAMCISTVASECAECTRARKQMIETLLCAIAPQLRRHIERHSFLGSSIRSTGVVRRDCGNLTPSFSPLMNATLRRSSPRHRQCRVVGQAARRTSRLVSLLGNARDVRGVKF